MNNWPIKETHPRLYMTPEQVEESRRKMLILKREYLEAKKQKSKKN